MMVEGEESLGDIEHGAKQCTDDEPCEESSATSCSLEVNIVKAERNCRICHLGLERPGTESRVLIELGCSCKDDLATAHKQCADRWFKIKGNKTCEICGSTATNMLCRDEARRAVPLNRANSRRAPPTLPVAATRNETQRCWRWHWLLNILLACIVFAFLLSWIFRFNGTH